MREYGMGKLSVMLSMAAVCALAVLPAGAASSAAQASEAAVSEPASAAGSASAADESSCYLAYRSILDAYYLQAEAGADMMALEDAGLNYMAAYTGSEETGGDYHTSLNYLGYQFVDLDEDGTYELLIGGVADESHGYTGMFYDLYALDNGEAGLCLRSGERSRFYVCNDHYISYQGSGGAAYTTFEFYRYAQGSVTFLEAIVCDGSYDENNPWFYCTDESLSTDYYISVSQSQAEAALSYYTEMSVEYIPFSSYAQFAAAADPSWQPSAETGDDEAGIHRYEYVVADATWEEAFEQAKAKGGYLAHINTAEEYQYILTELENAGLTNVHFWLGGRRNENDPNYRWVTAGNLLYGDVLNQSGYWACSEWMAGEPSLYDPNNGLSEAYLNLFYYSGENRWVWNDCPNDILEAAPNYSGKIGYIVEYEG